MPRGQFYSGTETPIAVLSRAVTPRLSDYDIVLVDCPPNLGIITLNGLLISQSYIIPTVPDVLSTYGIPQIVTRVREFSRDTGHPVEPLGIIVAKYQSNSAVHSRVRGQLRRNYMRDAPVFRTFIRQSNQIAAAAEYQRVKLPSGKNTDMGKMEAPMPTCDSPTKCLTDWRHSYGTEKSSAELCQGCCRRGRT